MGFEGESTGSWDAEMCTPIFDKLKHKVAQLSIQKFSSNVIEKCLEKALYRSRSEFIREIANMDKLAGLMKNSYGNYVVQKALNIAHGPDKECIAQAIYKNIPQIQDKKLRAKWGMLLYQSIEGYPDLANQFDCRVFIEEANKPSSQNSSPAKEHIAAKGRKSSNITAYRVFHTWKTEVGKLVATREVRVPRHEQGKPDAGAAAAPEVLSSKLLQLISLSTIIRTPL